MIMERESHLRKNKISYYLRNIKCLIEAPVPKENGSNIDEEKCLISSGNVRKRHQRRRRKKDNEKLLSERWNGDEEEEEEEN